jgi:hypothetical protein
MTHRAVPPSWLLTPCVPRPSSSDSPPTSRPRSKKLGEALVDLSKKELLYHDAMEAALGAVRSCVHPGLVEEVLQQQQDARLRRLGLAALVEAASPKHGWTKERRARLEEYRRDAAPGVSGPANFVFPP